MKAAGALFLCAGVLALVWAKDAIGVLQGVALVAVGIVFLVRP